jgi:hypothetical protein
MDPSGARHVSEHLIHELVFLDEMKGAAWPDLQRRWLQACVHILEKMWEHRLQEGHYPSRERFLANCALDADYLLDLLGSWGDDWRVGYVVIRIGQEGLYLHPDVKDVHVAGVPVAPLVRELLEFVGERGLGLGALDAKTLGAYESWDEPDDLHPRHALLQARPDAYQMAKAILRHYFEDPTVG